MLRFFLPESPSRAADSAINNRHFIASSVECIIRSVTLTARKFLDGKMGVVDTHLKSIITQ
jgi:hypothetical protein